MRPALGDFLEQAAAVAEWAQQSITGGMRVVTISEHTQLPLQPPDWYVQGCRHLNYLETFSKTLFALADLWELADKDDQIGRAALKANTALVRGYADHRAYMKEYQERLGDGLPPVARVVME